MKLRFVIPLVIFSFLLAVFWIGLRKDPSLLPSMLINHPVPSFTEFTLDNQQITEKAFTGRITLLNVWASWCENCQLEQPLLVDLSREANIQLIGLNYKDRQGAAQEFLNKLGNPYQQIIFDPKGQVAMQFGVYGTPESFLIDKKGVVRYRYVGPMTVTTYEKELLPRIHQLETEE